MKKPGRTKIQEDRKKKEVKLKPLNKPGYSCRAGSEHMRQLFVPDEESRMPGFEGCPGYLAK